MVKTAWVFPGQGSQSVGMGADLMEHPLGKERLAIADDILGWSVKAVCQSTDDKVSNTLYTQPCLYVLESLRGDVLREPPIWWLATVWASTVRYMQREPLILESVCGWSNCGVN